MIQVLMLLGAFNLLVSWFISETGGSVSYIHPSTMKATLKHEGLVIPKGGDKKTLTLNWAMIKEPSFPIVRTKTGKPQYCYDMADSFGIARAGFLRAYLSLNAKGTKATGDKSDAGA
jgi:hypothetical protein